MEIYQNPQSAPKERAEDLLGRMTAAEKLAQLCGVFAIPGMEERTAKFIPNGVGQISTLEFRTIENIRIEITVPFGCRAELMLPLSGQEQMPLDAGSYIFEYETVRPIAHTWTLGDPLKELLADAKAKAVLEQFIPGISQVPDSMRMSSILELKSNPAMARLREIDLDALQAVLDETY